MQNIIRNLMKYKSLLILIVCLILFINFKTIKDELTSVILNKTMPSNILYKDHGSYIEPALVYIKAGSFTIGGVLGSQRDEQPTRKTTI